MDARTDAFPVSRPALMKASLRMASTCCLAGIDRAAIPRLTSALIAANIPSPASIAQLDVTELGRLRPDLLICDVDSSDVDALELLRRIRFVLPDCLIAVYTRIMKRSWGVACHLAGVNGMLSKDADERGLAKGLRDVMRSGCYTDPRFAAA
jgi:DNA-binding NarL/FixJ family response regulator